MTDWPDAYDRFEEAMIQHCREQMHIACAGVAADMLRPIMPHVTVRNALMAASGLRGVPQVRPRPVVTSQAVD